MGTPVGKMLHKEKVREWGDECIAFAVFLGCNKHGLCEGCPLVNGDGRTCCLSDLTDALDELSSRLPNANNIFDAQHKRTT